jgi:hypothetical protein
VSVSVSVSVPVSDPVFVSVSMHSIPSTVYTDFSFFLYWLLFFFTACASDWGLGFRV